MRVPFSLGSSVSWAGAIAASVALTGCYVVPIQPNQHPSVVHLPAPAQAPQPTVIHVPTAPAGPLTFTARLYPSNESATAFGTVMAVVTNDLSGRGHFSTNINGESFTGLATRLAGSTRDGVANGTGNRGNFVNCRYSMNSPSLGTGNCRLSNGATFIMHVGG